MTDTSRQTIANINLLMLQFCRTSVPNCSLYRTGDFQYPAIDAPLGLKLSHELRPQIYNVIRSSLSKRLCSLHRKPLGSSLHYTALLAIRHERIAEASLVFHQTRHPSLRSGDLRGSTGIIARSRKETSQTTLYSMLNLYPNPRSMTTKVSMKLSQNTPVYTKFRGTFTKSP